MDFWFFNNDKTLKKAGLLDNMTDFHSHLLPVNDEGIPDIDEAVSILRQYHHFGIRKVWLTPRISATTVDTMNEWQRIFDELRQQHLNDKAIKGERIDIRLSSLNIIDETFQERLKKHQFIPYLDSSNHILIGTHGSKEPQDIMTDIQAIKDAGYKPVFVSPERCFYMDTKFYSQLRKHLDVKLLLDFPSLTGLYGPEAMKRAKMLLDANYYTYIGSDNHGMRKFYAAITEYKIESKYINKLKELRDKSVF